MKKGIHPKYYADAAARCSTCGAEYQFGSTMNNITVAICSKCHPFYTGEQQVVIDTANKISTFKDRMKKTAELKKRLAEIEAKRKEKEKNRVGVISRGNENRLTLKDLLQSKRSKN